ncbi:aminotransferase class V-fold PLP-dependent enzyme [Nocardiopsis akebiae]|uniref:Probable hercynylcysteine sulfoxide lyase n=1 Tax=Nocardiopsis akebiae TaxID=2831968 RepID=A0ABX8BXB2_9ACTN|nr:aminotransferase class V-fold PLP-dependent enzyme [Nocardiopsis akebiae]QUX26824.1 aminotransferase class V-fold PLP-dependent enzyme [Nocardiopsis akebiae]
MGVDVAAVRADTCGVGQAAHLDNAGSSLPPDVVVEAVVDHLRLEARVGGYAAAERAQAGVEGFYTAVARLVGARPEEIAFAESATRAWELAFGSVVFAEGERVLTTASEYPSNALGMVKAARERGVRVQVVPDDADGVMDVGALERELARGGVRVVALNHMPTHNGLVNPAERIGALCRRFGVLFVLDACQSAGQWDLDVERLGCDVLAVTGRKFLRGPRGTGFVYARSGADLGEPPVVDVTSAHWEGRGYRVREDARRFESFERNVAGQIGLGVAVDYALAVGMEPIRERVGALAEQARDRLGRLAGVRVLDRGRVRSGIVTFAVEGVAAEGVRAALGEAGVRVSVSRLWNQVWEPGVGVDEAVRASVHYFNTEAEVEALADAVKGL